MFLPARAMVGAMEQWFQLETLVAVVAVPEQVVEMVLLHRG